MTALPQRCLMLITERSPRLAEIVREAVAGGVNAVQVRDKSAQILGFQKTVLALHRETGDAVPLLINADWQKAVGFGARQIHLPEQSVPVGVVRHKIGPDGLIGKSVHSVAAAVTAQAQGADYLIAGTIFASASHPDTAPAGLEFLESVCQSVTIPVLAVGGITPERVPACLAAGAAGVAVLSAILHADDPRAAAQAFHTALEGGRP